MRVSTNPIRTRADWLRMRDACITDPGAFHGEIAKREIHWYDPALGAWLTWDDTADAWIGYDARTGAPIRADYGPDHVPWQRAFNDDEAPFYRWFEGGLTNAAFNEVDRHVLAGYGDEPAFLVEGDRWDQSLDGGRGGPVVAERVTRKQLLWEVAKAAVALQSLGLRRGDRIALNMPNIPEQIYYTEAAKRLGIIYTPVFGGFSDKTLSDRIHDAGARVIITADGGYRNAQIVPFKEAYTDPALDNYIAVDVALEVVRDCVAALALPDDHQHRIIDSARDAVADEITVERSDVMRGVGRALAALSDALSAADASRIRTAVAQALVDAPPRVDAVVVVRHTEQPELLWRPERDRWSHDLTDHAAAAILAAAQRTGVRAVSVAELLALPDREFVAAIWATTTPEPVDAEFPLFFIYTSGSTGKPKGVVHVHGGYVAGIAYTMRVAFDARPGDVIYVIADPGWITGQSYMISAALTTRCPSVLAEGAPVFPSAGRFASIIERYGVTIFKAGVTFLKTVMQDPQNALDVRQYDLSSLRVATFCAEPVSPSVQQFGMDLMCRWYINSYWATEHGGIAWTHFYHNPDFPLRADAHTYPLPWVLGDVWVADGDRHRAAAPGEKGEIVIRAPYPYLARTIWGDLAHFGQGGWKGDFERYKTTYWTRWRGALAYTQGDFAVAYDDGSFSLHGRSDDVINVSGHRMGTEEIEGAILRDKQINPESPVGNVIVVGAPHREKGLTPIAFIKPATGARITADDRRRLAELVRQEKGAVAVPSDFIEVTQFPETRSGKYMRRMVRALVEDAPVGDATTLKNPESLDELARAIDAWRIRQRISDEQTLFETYRYFRIQFNAVTPTARVATVTVTNPPVNALNERALDELNTVVEHLARRDDVRAVIITGDGTSSFVAGADIRQLLDEAQTIEEALPLPNNAHLAFRKIERMGKPCIAAVNGVALGGGLEFALACHYRVAEPVAAFGQPEIRLRLLPGYGGTQRLPRLLADELGAAGLRHAVEIIIGGRTLDADDAEAIGLVDRVARGSEDVLSIASALARQYVLTGDGPLAEAFAARRERLAEWARPATIPFEVEGDPEIARLIRQAGHAGRARAVERALEAIRYGWASGIDAGLRHEAELFAQAVVDPSSGKEGIRQFLDKRSAPLPTRRPLAESADALIAAGDLLPMGSPFFPGHTPIPRYQYAFAVARDPETGAACHDDPISAEREIILPVETPGPAEAIVYVLAAEVNYNDIWAITGIPVSQFDAHDADAHVTGSGGVGLIVALGSEVKAEGRLRVGDLVTVYSGQSDLLSPLAGRDPMYAGFQIQGYETPDGSHQQFLKVQGPQLFPVPQDLTLEAAGSYILNLGTVVRALFTTLAIEAGKTLFVEGAATGTGMETVKSAVRSGLHVVGLVSSADRASAVVAAGAMAAINRKDPAYRDLFTPVPSHAIAAWERAGAPLMDEMRAHNNGRLADYVVSHAGETAFPRSFQLLESGGTLTFYGATSGYYFTFVGKSGAASPAEMLRRAKLEPNEAVLIYYGTATTSSPLVDPVGLEAIEGARAAGARIVVVTYTDGQREFVQSLGFGERVKGVVSLEEIRRREGDDFDWPSTMPPLPDPKTDTDGHREAVRAFQDRTMKPLGAAIGRFLRSPDNPRGYPDLIVERAGHDALGASTSLVKPFTGRVVYCEDLGGHRFAFHAPQVWMRQRRILMPTATIRGTHLSNAYEVVRMNQMIEAGLLDVTEPVVVAWGELPAAHQAMWENRHAGASYVCNHALPVLGLRTRTELMEAWATR
jgi:acrylyl-CoA reductase (NADPH) / 3-hydroxypropionyl-CoA dehydratase / 3-hydroxypropionyl-CoA synthetase